MSKFDLAIAVDQRRGIAEEYNRKARDHNRRCPAYDVPLLDAGLGPKGVD